ncbi:DUF1353 domain-containing protein [Gracilimonas sp. BCB1]|uniref:DUF1353 domain-containing protein n=1 Tax=Gracilimonas sp. BCB1 TaxID=3152362 RepID=UPI0032D8E379
MILYKKRRHYKYTLVESYSRVIDIRPDEKLGNDFLYLDSNGKLFISEGYSWDGPSGPTIDTKNFLQGSLVHDALYQLIREQHLDFDNRKYADELLREMCMEDHMSKIRAFFVYWAVRLFGASSAKPDTLKAP